MAKQPRERGVVFFYKVPLTVKVHGPLYASSATTTGGIKAALKRNMPTEAQIAYRESIGEEIKPLDELTQEIADSIPEGVRVPSTVFRRDADGRPFIHANFLKGHIRDCGETAARILNFWGLKDFITRTLFVTPNKVYLDGDLETLTTYFTPDVIKGPGIKIKQPTEKTEECLESPELSWNLYLLGDPRWDRDLLVQLLLCGSPRGIGPGRGRCESQYEYEVGEFEKVARVPIE